MALTTTTNSAAIGQQDTSITVASATSMQANMLIRINGEWMQISKNYVSGTNIPVQRGLDGSVQSAHGVTSNVTFGVASDFAILPPAAGVADAVTVPAQPALPIKAYGAAGAIDVRQHIAIINGTSALAMTLVSPTKDMDGQMCFVISNGKANHTLTYTTTGFGAIGATADVLTFHATMQQAVLYIAAGGTWCLVGQVAGSASVAGVGLG